MKNIRYKINSNVILRRTLYTMLILIVFSIGNHIYLPFINQKMLEKLSENSSLLFVGNSTGANYTKMTLFSLGLGPWMSSLIVWQLLSSIKAFKLDKIPQKKSQFYQHLITLAIAILQGVGLIIGFKLVNDNFYHKLVVLIIMLAGAFYLVWLGSMNTEKGIGGSILLVVINMITNASSQISLVLTENKSYFWTIILTMIVIGLVVIYLSVKFDRSEFRIPLTRLMLESSLKERTYFPIKLNPGGMMAIMFALSLNIIPTFGFSLLNQSKYHSLQTQWLVDNMGLTKPFGVTFYIVILFVLAYAFSFINISPSKNIKDLRESGDYLADSRPGKESQKLLTHYISVLGIVGAIYTVIISGFPVYLGIIYPKYSQIFLLPGTLLMMTTMVLQISDYINIITIKKRYSELL